MFLLVERIGPESPRGALDTVRTLMREYGAMPHTIGRWTTVEHDIAALPAPFVAPGGVLLLLSDADTGSALGCGGLRQLELEVAEVKRMYLRPEARGRGAGEALLRALLGCAAQLGYARVRLDTAPELTVAQALYAKLGFTPIDRYLDGQLPDALCYERPVTADDLRDALPPG